MVLCATCGHENPEHILRCGKCNQPLDHTLAYPADFRKQLLEHLQTQATRAVTESVPEAEERLVDTSDLVEDTDTLREVKTGQLQFQGDLILTDEESKVRFIITAAQLQEAIIGRKSDATGFQPTIDLSELDGLRQGVSRRHATLQKQADVILITDHTSRNGTYLNEIRLAPERPRVVRNGDIIRIGRINLHVRYQIRSTSRADSGS